MKALAWLCATLALFAVLRAQTPAPTPTRAQDAGGTGPRSTIDVSKLGPQVGELVPDFTLTDQNGKRWTRQSIMGPKGAMLVFIRSADW